jgi:hypothetical protein
MADEEQAAGTHCEEWLQEIGREGGGEFEREETERQGRGGGDFAEGGEIARGGDGNEEAFGRSVLEKVLVVLWYQAREVVAKATEARQLLEIYYEKTGVELRNDFAHDIHKCLECSQYMRAAIVQGSIRTARAAYTIGESTYTSSEYGFAAGSGFMYGRK